jgi:hypothetical protein
VVDHDRGGPEGVDRDELGAAGASEPAALRATCAVRKMPCQFLFLINLLLPNLSNVCPEPVLANDRFP